MAGMYLREMQRLGLVNRALVVCPAHLVTKWQADFERFFDGGLKRITADTAKDGPLRPDQDLWITSLDLAAVNPMVQEVIRPDRAGWDVVVFDEAHRLTPTAQGYYQVGRMLCYGCPRVLLMTATPHRGSEWLFRSLLHLVDPAVFPPSEKDEEPTHHVKPGRIHFIRRMKEELLDYDGVTPLFKGRRASNIAVPLNAAEAAFYQQALDLVETYFPGVGGVETRAEVTGVRGDLAWRARPASVSAQPCLPACRTLRPADIGERRHLPWRRRPAAVRCCRAPGDQISSSRAPRLAPRRVAASLRQMCLMCVLTVWVEMCISLATSAVVEHA